MTMARDNREQFTKGCLHCGHSFTGLKWAKFCSGKCRVAAHRAGKKRTKKRSAK